MIKNFFSQFVLDDLTIDFTSGIINIYKQGPNGGLKVCEPATLVIDGESCLAIGDEAESIRGKSPEGIKIIEPIANGIISEPEYAEQLIKTYIKEIFGKKPFYCLGPDAMVVVPQRITEAHKKILIDTLDSAGIKNINLTSTLIAASQGVTGVADRQKAFIILSINQDYTEIGVMCMNKLHYSNFLPIGYFDFIRGLSDYIRDNSDFSLGLYKAHWAMQQVGTVHLDPENDKNRQCEVHALLKRTSVPQKISITSELIEKAMEPLVSMIVSGLMQTLENAKEDMAEDIAKNGVRIVGFGSKIHNIDRAISTRLNIKCEVEDDAPTTIVDGAARIQKLNKKY